MTLPVRGCSGASVRGMRKLKIAASAYRNTITAIAASGGVSMPVSIIGTSMLSKLADTRSPSNCPPNNTPRMMDKIVKPSIQPLALTN